MDSSLSSVPWYFPGHSKVPFSFVFLRPILPGELWRSHIRLQQPKIMPLVVKQKKHTTKIVSFCWDYNHCSTIIDHTCKWFGFYAEGKWGKYFSWKMSFWWKEIEAFNAISLIQIVSFENTWINRLISLGASGRSVEVVISLSISTAVDLKPQDRQHSTDFHSIFPRFPSCLSLQQFAEKKNAVWPSAIYLTILCLFPQL